MSYKSCETCKYDYAPCTEPPCKPCVRCSHWEISEELLAIGRRAGIKEALAVCKDVHKSAQADAIDLDSDDDDFEEAFLNGREIGAEACIDKVRELLEAK